MKVRHLMAKDVLTCQPDTDLARAGWLMWESDCGALPVMDEGKLVGIVTDRDVAICGATHDRPCQDIPIRELLGSRRVLACHPDDEIEDALELMAVEQIRRLPVVDSDRRLAGILSLNDVILAAERAPRREPGSPSYDRVMTVLKSISEHRRPFHAQIVSPDDVSEAP